ncbi:hypothetical protein VE01_04647 [Pseudogymnoascus verrucosus]|uniref:LysM domain-containing protein n=1 Tax=Pseudogymnoascus verrucosus TaxID=342668 RepID=A0A1B8GN41_9PEZI|nr:uncharacterized protein VE01_04647 [Pseudogymnoascus verrucosus]OBT97208.1 hypothetical protein VE01_04647 [Pseudogymnoascus verrucosus]
MTPQGGTVTATAPVPGISIAPGYNKGYAQYLALPPANATTATGTTLNCGKYHGAATGETCATICVKEAIYIALFLQVNPSLNLNDYGNIGASSSTTTATYYLDLYISL